MTTMATAITIKRSGGYRKASFSGQLFQRTTHRDGGFRSISKPKAPAGSQKARRAKI